MPTDAPPPAAEAVDAEARALLDRLNGWCASYPDECLLFEFPDASPDRVPSGETNGFLGDAKQRLDALGVDYFFDRTLGRYRAWSEADGPQLDSSVAPDAPAAYAAVRDAADWRNPYLIVRADGIEIRSSGTSHVVAADALAGALASLPASAWPYGRVVAVQEQSIRAGDGTDDEPIRHNKEMCESALRHLGITASWWPSA